MNAHLIRIAYASATDSKSSRVRLTSQRFERNAIAIPYDHSYNGTFDIARLAGVARLHDRVQRRDARRVLGRGQGIRTAAQARMTLPPSPIGENP